MQGSGQQGQNGQLAGGGVHVVGGLGHVDMVVGMDDGIIALLAAQDLNGPVGDHFVGIHIGRGARAALDGVDDELVVQLAFDHLVAGLDDGVGDLGIQGAGMLVGNGRCLFDLGQADDQLVMHRVAGDGEIQLAAQGLHAVVCVYGDFQCTDGIGFCSSVHSRVPLFGFSWLAWGHFLSRSSIHYCKAGVKS